MTRFTDQLLADLMAEYRPGLERAGLHPAAGRRPVPRPVWLAAGAAGVAGAVTAGVIGLGGGTPAYAVTQNPDGTLTVSVNRPDGVPGANARLRALGSHVVVVPVKAGCPPIYSLAARDPSARRGYHRSSGVAKAGRGGTVTMDVHGIPAGDIAVVAAESLPGGGMATAVTITRPPAPSCVAPLPAPPAGGSGSAHSGSGGGRGPGTAVSGGGPGS